METVHPYFPLDTVVYGYIENDIPYSQLLTTIGGACAAILASAYGGTSYIRPLLPLHERLTVLWFTLCASLHLIFEAYFVWHWNNLAAQQGILGQLWKEYSLSDSRYLTQDPSVLCLEIITVIFWGPFSLTTAYMILTNHPIRHGVQIIVCMAHLYGVVIYYTTSLFEMWFHGSSYSRPEPLYFWVYFIGFNAPWFCVPLILIWQSLKAISNSFEKGGTMKSKAH